MLTFSYRTARWKAPALGCRTGAAGIRPNHQQAYKLRVRNWRRCTALTGIPGPEHEWIRIRAHVLHERRKIPSAIEILVLERGAELGLADPLPPHRFRGDAPIDGAGDECDLAVLAPMTRAAAGTGSAVSIRPARDLHQMRSANIAICRGVAARMTVQAARVLQHSGDRIEWMWSADLGAKLC